jgi:sugar phosphate isomerase/epimerase
MAREAGIGITGLHSVLVGPEGLHISSPDARVRRQTQDYFLALVEFCHDLDGKAVVFGSPNQRRLIDGVSYQQAWEYTQEALLEAARAAEGTQVCIGLEPLRPELTDFINTAEEARAFVKEVNHPHLRIALDCYSMSSESLPISEIIRASKDYLCHFHANDDNKREPGSGGVDFFSVGRALKEVDFQEYVSIEVFEFEEDPEAMAERGLRHLKEAFAS